MKIIGHGIDLVSVDRFQKMIQSKKKHFFLKIFTQKEIKSCQGKANAAQKFAARFAAKEAFMKALGTGWASGVRFRDIEICTKKSGEPEVKLHGKVKLLSTGKKINKIFVTFSHDENITVASVLLCG